MVTQYYPNIAFAKVDIVLVFMYLFDSPFRISKRYLIKKGETEIYAYGETPLTTLAQVAEVCQIGESDVVIELGCGRGRTCFWLNRMIGCRVVGVEYIPDFVERAQRIQMKLGSDGVEFRCEDMLQTDLSDATVIYLYGTCLGEDFIRKLINRFRDLPAGTRVITVSYPLSDYTEEPLFEVMHCFPAKFSWGVGDVYIQTRVASN